MARRFPARPPENAPLKPRTTSQSTRSRGNAQRDVQRQRFSLGRQRRTRPSKADSRDKQRAPRERSTPHWPALRNRGAARELHQAEYGRWAIPKRREKTNQPARTTRSGIIGRQEQPEDRRKMRARKEGGRAREICKAGRAEQHACQMHAAIGRPDQRERLINSRHQVHAASQSCE